MKTCSSASPRHPRHPPRLRLSLGGRMQPRRGIDRRDTCGNVGGRHVAADGETHIDGAPNHHRSALPATDDGGRGQYHH